MALNFGQLNSANLGIENTLNVEKGGAFTKEF